MGPLQRTPGKAPTAFSQDHPRLRRRERISLVKNRMREICTSGSVRGGGGNVPTYSAAFMADRREVTLEGLTVGEWCEGAEEGKPARVVECDQSGEEQAAEQLAQDADRQAGSRARGE